MVDEAQFVDATQATDNMQNRKETNVNPTKAIAEQNPKTNSTWKAQKLIFLSKALQLHNLELPNKSLQTENLSDYLIEKLITFTLFI